MTIPNVYINWCQREAECHWCHKKIEAGTPIVTAFFWNKGNVEKRGWNTKLYYHPNCWVAQGLDYLRLNPYSPYIRKKKAELSPTDRKERLRLLRAKGSLDQRRRNLTTSYPERVLIEARIDRQISELMHLIAKVGGIPKKWLE